MTEFIQPAEEKFVLIVDDEESILSVLSHSLMKFGAMYKVVTANSGASALEQLTQRSFDLVVTDYRMDDMNGLELLEAIHAVQPRTRVIMMTAYGNADLESEADRLNAYHYMTKPLDINTFRQVVNDALANGPKEPHGILAMAENHYCKVNDLLHGLEAEVGARCIFLTNGDGQFIARTGNVENLPLEHIACLVSCGVASLMEVGRLIDDGDDRINLCYREGTRENIYVINIGRQFLLIIICSSGPYSGRLGSVWYCAKKVASELHKLLEDANFGIPNNNLAQGIVGRSLEHQLESLFMEDSPVKEF